MQHWSIITETVNEQNDYFS